jgi:lysophospholipase L1-like esterase
MIFGQGERIVFIGDSITSAGRGATHAPFGDGYVDLVRTFVASRYPELALTWINRGVNGDTVRHLKARWMRDAIESAPDWLSVKIGINDVWRRFLGHPEEAVPLLEFEDTLRDLIDCVRLSTGCHLILVDPYVVEADRTDLQRRMTEQYAAVVGKLAQEFDTIHVRTQAAFDRVLRFTKSEEWSGDRIHLNRMGHAVIAQEFLQEIGFALGRSDK